MDTPLRERFNRFLLDDFIAEGTKGNGETHRWMFCHDFVNHPEGGGWPDDCACCLQNEEDERCDCVCHKRIGQIVGFIDQEATKRTVAALEGVLESVAKYKHWAREQYLSATDKEQTMLAYDMDSRTIAAQQIETKIHDAIKQAKGEA